MHVFEGVSSWPVHGCFTMETKLLCKILRDSKMASFMLFWQCISKSFLPVILEKRFEEIDYLQHCRRFGTSFTLLIFPRYEKVYIVL